MKSNNIHKPTDHEVIVGLGLLARGKVALLLHVLPASLHDRVNRGLIPPPTVRVGRRLYYTQAEFLVLKQHFETCVEMPSAAAGLWSRSRMASELGLTQKRLAKLVKRGILAPPAHQVTGLRQMYYRADDYRRMVAALEDSQGAGAEPPGESVVEQEGDGWLILRP